MRRILHSCKLMVVLVPFLLLLLLILLIIHTVDLMEHSNLWLRLQQEHTDNAYAATTLLYNACFLEGRQVLATLPAEHTASPVPPESPEELKNQQDPLPTCQKLFKGKKLTAEEEKWIDSTNSQKQDDPATFLAKVTNCTWVREHFSNNYFVSDQEKAFPIAYAINLNEYPEQILRFLKVIYRPHNLHCLHYDLKSDPVTRQAVRGLASCLGNVIVPRRLENVYRGWHTLVDAHFSCFSDLLLAQDRYPWHYVLTLCGKELPLRTNAEIVSMLQPLNGTSSIRLVGREGEDAESSRFRWKWSLDEVTGVIATRDRPQDPVPRGMKVYKSSAYLALGARFVEHVLCSAAGRELSRFMRDVYIPEESIYAMLYMKPDTPGGYDSRQTNNTFLLTTSIWIRDRGVLPQIFPSMVCAGRVKHGICILAAQDLKRVTYKPGVSGYGAIKGTYRGKDIGPLFHNRYRLAWDRVVIECMERELIRRNRLEYRMVFSTTHRKG